MWTDLLTTVAQNAPYECVTQKRMVELTRLKPDAVAAGCERLLGRRFLRRTDKGCLQLTAAGRAAAEELLRNAPKPGRSELYERVWCALNRDFTAAALGARLTVGDIVLVVAEGGERHIEVRIRGYLRVLARAGYVRQMRIREPGVAPRSNGYVRWQLTRFTGPLAPIWRAASNAVSDANTGETIRLAKSYARAARRKAAP